MEQDPKIQLHQPMSLFPINVIITWEGHINQTKVINSPHEMNILLEEVKLYNSENSDKKRIIST